MPGRDRLVRRRRRNSTSRRASRTPQGRGRQRQRRRRSDARPCFIGRGQNRPGGQDTRHPVLSEYGVDDRCPVRPNEIVHILFHSDRAAIQTFTNQCLHPEPRPSPVFGPFQFLSVEFESLPRKMGARKLRKKKSPQQRGIHSQ